MKVAIASVEWDADPGTEDGVAAAMALWLQARGHEAERIVIPMASRVPPQQSALACQLLATDAYADALWALNFPACALPHARKRVWFTTARPFAPGRGPRLDDVAALLGDEARVTVGCEALARALALPGVRVGLPPGLGATAEHAAGPADGAPLVVVAATGEGTEGRTDVVRAGDRGAQRRIREAAGIVVEERDLAFVFDLVLCALAAGVAVFVRAADGSVGTWGAAIAVGAIGPMPDAVTAAQRAWLQGEYARSDAEWAGDLGGAA